ncbi:hypothetical protein [Nocardia vermiculata]|nr:hypothetical protein [Nocardia vermiculata]
MSRAIVLITLGALAAGAVVAARRPRLFARLFGATTVRTFGPGAR